MITRILTSDVRDGLTDIAHFADAASALGVTKADIPTKQTLAFVVLRVAGLHKLCSASEEVAARAYTIHRELLSRKYFASYAAVALSVSARLCVLTRGIRSLLGPIYFALRGMIRLAPECEIGGWMEVIAELPERLTDVDRKDVSQKRRISPTEISPVEIVEDVGVVQIRVDKRPKKAAASAEIEDIFATLN